MSPRKLTEDDKQEILRQYRTSEATTSTLAQSFEVSSSTISRFLKNNLSANEYEDLIQQKRLARTPRGEKASLPDKPKRKRRSRKAKAATIVTPTLEVTAEEVLVEVEETAPKPKRRRRRRSTPKSEEVAAISQPKVTELTLDLEIAADIAEETPDGALPKESLILKSDRAEIEEDDEMELITLKEMLGEDLEDINDEDDDEDDEDDDWVEDSEIEYPSKTSSLSDIQILPLSQATLPRICYLVIDRSAELIVKPLADFADLGSIPETEVKQRTLPVFDNHRIAKRFSHRRERVIKVPDGRMLQKTSYHLQVKGITRLLIDGQVYSLSN